MPTSQLKALESFSSISEYQTCGSLLKKWLKEGADNGKQILHNLFLIFTKFSQLLCCCWHKGKRIASWL